MYAKKGFTVFIICLICLLLFTLSSCCTRAAVYGNGDGAYKVREYIGEFEDKQTESAVTSERLSGAIEGARKQSENLSGELTRSREQSEHLEQSITNGASELESFAAILQRIRERGRRNNSNTAGNNQQTKRCPSSTHDGNYYSFNHSCCRCGYRHCKGQKDFFAFFIKNARQHDYRVKRISG